MSLIHVVLPTTKRTSVLYTFVKQNRYEKKIVIVCSEAKNADYFNELMSHLFIESVVVHEKKERITIISNLEKFHNESVIMFTTNAFVNNNLSKRHLRKNEYTFIQYDSPTNFEKFLGFFNKCHSGKNSVMLFLHQEAKEYVKKLKEANIKIKKVCYDESKLEDIPPHVSKLVYVGMPGAERHKTPSTGPHRPRLKETFDVETLRFEIEAININTMKIISMPMHHLTKKTMYYGVLMSIEKARALELMKAEKEKLKNKMLKKSHKRRRIPNKSNLFKDAQSDEAELDVTKRARLHSEIREESDPEVPNTSLSLQLELLNELEQNSDKQNEGIKSLIDHVNGYLAKEIIKS